MWASLNIGLMIVLLTFAESAPIFVPSVLECGDEKFSCGSSGECTYKAWLCDGEEDCENGQDENKTNCGKV